MRAIVVIAGAGSILLIHPQLVVVLTRRPIDAQCDEQGSPARGEFELGHSEARAVGSTQETLDLRPQNWLLRSVAETAASDDEDQALASYTRAVELAP